MTHSLDYFQSKRKFPNWQPLNTTDVVQNTNNREAEVIRRCLMFLPLEVPVGQWITSTSDVDDDTKVYLLRNAQDEEKHDRALHMLSAHYQAKSDKRADELIQRWLDNESHPIAKAYALEMGVFFTILPTLLRYGDTYAATVASWISDDERCHVETNLFVLKKLGLKLTKDLLTLIADTVCFIFSNFGAERAQEEVVRAVKRTISGKDEQMLEESLPVTIAYFEQHNKQTIVY